jgi:hypothetical protein
MNVYDMMLLCLTLSCIYLFIFCLFIVGLKYQEYKLQFLHSIVQDHYVLIVMLVSYFRDYKMHFIFQKVLLKILLHHFYGFKLQNEEHTN